MNELKYWENPYIIKENKEDAHCLAPYYSDFKAAAFGKEPQHKLLLNGTLPAILIVVGTALVGCIGMSCGMQGWYFSKGKKISMAERLIITASGLCMMIPGWLTDVIGLVILIGMYFFCHAKYGKKTKTAAA